MDVSCAYTHSSPSIFSPDSQFVLSLSGDRLVLRIASTLQLHKTWKLEKPADASSSCQLAFSPCSRRLLACLEAVKTVFAFSVDSNNEVARIEAGSEGCRGAAWISETQIAVWSEHGLRVTIWSLATGASQIINWPAHGPDRGWALRPSDKRYLALAEQHEGRNVIGIYDGHRDWQLARHFSVATHDLRGLAWSPCSRYLAIWDDSLDYALYIYALDGRQEASFLPFRGEQNASLGLRTVAWHPSGEFIALAGFDGRIRILNDSWTSIAELTPSSKVSRGTAMFREPADWIARTHAKGIIPFDRVSTPQTLQSVADASKMQTGISMMRWSPSGTLLACVSAATPAAVYVFAFAGGSQALTPHAHPEAVILLEQPVTALEWQPLIESETLMIASGVQGVCMWNAQGSGLAEGVGIPSASNLSVRQLAWSTDGTQLLLNDKSSFVVGYPLDS